MTGLTMSIQGMSCGNCVRHVESALRELPGVKAVTVELASGRANVEYQPAMVTLDALKKSC